MLEREVPSHLNSHFRFEHECDESDLEGASDLGCRPGELQLDLDMEMELYEFIDDLRAVNERLNLEMPPSVAVDRSLCAGGAKPDDDLHNFELESTFISYRDQSHDTTALQGDPELLLDFAQNSTFASLPQGTSAPRARLFSEFVPPSTLEHASNAPNKTPHAPDHNDTHLELFQKTFLTD